MSLKIIKYKDYREAVLLNRIQDLLKDNDYKEVQFKYVESNESDEAFMKFKFNFVNIYVMENVSVKISEKSVFTVKDDGFYFEDELIIKTVREVEGIFRAETFTLI